MWTFGSQHGHVQCVMVAEPPSSPSHRIEISAFWSGDQNLGHTGSGLSWSRQGWSEHTSINENLVRAWQQLALTRPGEMWHRESLEIPCLINFIGLSNTKLNWKEGRKEERERGIEGGGKLEREGGKHSPMSMHTVLQSTQSTLTRWWHRNNSAKWLELLSAYSVPISHLILMAMPIF